MQCGQVGTTATLKADHILPLSNGGPDHETNMQTLCEGCHRAKTEREREGQPDPGKIGGAGGGRSATSGPP